MGIPSFIKKKIDASKAGSEEDSSTADSSEDTGDSPVPPKKGKGKAENPLMAWAKSRA